MQDKYLIVVAGPTGVGKTALAIDIAEKYATEIVSADSRQFYKELTIGTAKPDSEQLKKVKHHFINTLSIQDEYNAGRYEEEALICLQCIFQARDVAILCGGSGLFIDAVCRGFDELPEKDDEIRKKLIDRLEREGLKKMAEELRIVDPEYAAKADLANPVRVMRALEVYYISGVPFSKFRTRTKKQRFFKTIKICLTCDRNLLYKRIDERMEAMIKTGLIEEAQSLYQYKHLNALQTVGYSEIFGYLEGKYDKEEMIRLLKRNSRRYAKRQLTWFQKDPEYCWFDIHAKHDIFAYIEQNLVKSTT
jgi:tRNA dimethylallyltransferase